MANQLTLPNGTPYNIVFEGGRAYFAPAVFGSVGSSIPKEFRIVPASLVPLSYVTQNGKRYAYIPESSIAEYVNGDSFKRAVSTYQGTGTGVGNFVAFDAISRARTEVIDTVRNMDQASRAQAWQTVPKRKDPTPAGSKLTVTAPSDSNYTIPTTGKTGALFNKGEQGGSGVSGNSYWSELQNSGSSLGATVNADGSLSVQRAGQDVFLYADKSGKVRIYDPTDYVQKILGEKPAVIKQYQQYLKNAGFLGSDYKANGKVDIEGKFTSALMESARRITQDNWVLFQTPGSKGIDPISALAGYAKNGNGGQYQSRTTTDVTKTATDFSVNQSRAILEDFYATAVGRRPTDKEVKAFNNAINKAAKAKPNVVKATTTTSGTGSSATSRKVTQGYGEVDARTAARKMAESDPKSHSFLTNTKYFDAVLNAMRKSNF